MTALTTSAMLVSLNISQWSARKHDKRVSSQVAREHNTDDDVGRYNKVLIAKEALKDVSAIVSEARTHHYANTLPWLDNGFRILPAANYWDYVNAQRGFRAQFHDAVRAFRENYDSYVDEARLRLNGLFDPADYPPAHEIEEKFDFDIGYTPLPDAEDFRVSLGEAEEARIRAAIEERVRKAADEAMRDLWNRVHKAVSHMSERLNAYRADPATGRVEGCFRDSLVGNLRDLVELLPKLNVTGDPALDEMRLRLSESLTRHDAQELRDDPLLRRSVADAADNILADMAGYVGEATPERSAA